MSRMDFWATEGSTGDYPGKVVWGEENYYPKLFTQGSTPAKAKLTTKEIGVLQELAEDNVYPEARAILRKLQQFIEVEVSFEDDEEEEPPYDGCICNECMATRAERRNSR